MLAVDIGNTHINMYRFEKGQIVWRGRLATPEVDFPIIKKLYRDAGAGQAVVSSVVRPVNKFFARALAEAGAERVFFIDPAEHEIIAHDLSTPQTTGSDRLLAALAARMFKPKEAVVVVQAGTAVTVDCVDREGVFRGGFIMPGPMMWLDSLSGAAQLPFFEPREINWDARQPGRCTREAILGGAAAGLRGAIKEAVRLASITCGGAPALLFTGGWGGVLAEMLPGEYRPELVGYGIFFLARKLNFI